MQIRYAPQAPGNSSAVLTALTKARETPVTALSGIASARTSGPAGPAGPAGVAARQRTVAHGVARARNGRIRLDLPGADRLPPGRYVLHLDGKRRGTAFVVG